MHAVYQWTLRNLTRKDNRMPGNGFHTITLSTRTLELLDRLKNSYGDDEFGQPYSRPQALHLAVQHELDRAGLAEKRRRNAYHKKTA